MNDTFGHPAGDQVLKTVVAAFKHVLRGDDIIARIGVEEFGLILCDLRSKDAGAIDWLCDALLATPRREARRVAVVAKVGAAASTLGPSERLSSLLQSRQSRIHCLHYQGYHVDHPNWRVARSGVHDLVEMVAGGEIDRRQFSRGTIEVDNRP